MKHFTRTYPLASVLLALAGTSTAQSSSPFTELIQWQKPTIPDSSAVLVCASTNLIINNEQKRIGGKKASDAYVTKQVQVDDMPYAMTRQKLDGHKARRVRLSANGQDVERWVVAAKADRLHLFSFVQPAGQAVNAVPGIVASIKLK